MEYFIDYNNETGRILGFLIGTNANQKTGTLVQVSRLQWHEAKKFNTITVGSKGGIVFSNVDYRTEEEIIEQENNSNWNAFNSYCNTLEVTITNENKYLMSDKARSAMRDELVSMTDSDTLNWMEDWGVQVSTKADFQEAFNEYKKLKDIKFNEIFGGE